MTADGHLRDVELGGDLPRRETLSHQLDHLPLAPGQVDAAVTVEHDGTVPPLASPQVAEQRRDEPARDGGLAPDDASDDVQEPAGVDVSRQVAARTGPHGGEELVLVRAPGEDDDGDARRPRDDVGDRAQAPPGRLEVEETDVGPL